MNNIERYIQKAVKRELAAQGRVARRNDSKRRHIDYRAYAIRHSDGLRDIAAKLKEKAVSLANEFKQMKGGQKIAVVLFNLVKLAGTLFAVKSAADIKRSFAQIEREKNNLINLSDAWQKQGIEMNAGNEKKAVALKSGLKVIAGMLSVLLAAAGEKVVAAGLPKDYTEENYPNG